MKTNTKISAIFLIISMMFASSTFANNKSFDFEEEAYIDDIPFNTEWVVNELMISAIDFEEEAYVNDIPFNTAEIVANYNYVQSTLVVYEMEEENYIDDIPFNTEYIADLKLIESFNFEEEASIDDIPFNTQYVVETLAYNKVLNETFEIEDETYVDDIPFNTCLVAMETLSENNFIALKK